MLELHAGLQVIGEAKDGRQAVRLALELSPDVVLMDIAMPGLNGLEATRQLLQARPGMRILILTAHNDDAYVGSAMASGAMGFVLKQTSADQVCCAIRQVHGGRGYFSPSIARRLERAGARPHGRKDIYAKKMTLLSSREMEVLQLVAEGKANKETAGFLCISIKTVEKHRQQVMNKLNIHDVAGLTRYAITQGVIEMAPRLA
jgi:DNA-binding NarL/FixJ family response regulator